MEATMNEGAGGEAAKSTAAAGGQGYRSPAQGTAAPAEPKGKSARKPLIVLGLIGAIAGGAYIAHSMLTANQEDTDDAQVESDVVPVAARTGGQVLHVMVHDNQRVHAGDVLLEIDPQEATARVAQAEAELATQRAQAAAADADAQLVGSTAQAGLHTARASVTNAVDTVRSAQAQVTAAQAALDRSRAQAALTAQTLQRATALRADNAISQAELDAARANNDAAEAAVAQAEAQVVTARASRQAAQSHVGEAQGRLEQSAPVDTQLAAARARAELAHARVRSAEAALELARLSLSYTRVTAVSDGVVTRLNAHEGQLIAPGQPIAELVPETSYVVANFKETQVGRMHPGERVHVKIDAYPGRTFDGEVESIAGGTGARFSLMPPDNASGNFVKVVQRVPVRIRWANVPRDVALRAGLSAEVTVFVDGR